MTMQDLPNRFTYHPPKGDLRRKALELASLIDDMTPDSREKSLAITHLEDAVMWANAGIARNE